MNEQAFRHQLEQDGYDEPVELVREANLENDDHTHDFSASALILDGEVNVITAEGTITCRAGDTFALAGGTVHHERYGPQGARFLLGKRSP